MENYKLVLPGHLNHYGYLFGGTLSLLRFEVDKKRAGTTSVQYTVNVYREDLGTQGGGSVFTTTVTFVCLDETGAKRALSKCGG
jgi:acyl-CoA hydrolase